LLFLEQFDEVDARGFRFRRSGRLGRRQLGIDDGIDESGGALRPALKVDLHARRIERIEAHFDGLAGEIRGRFVKTILQQEGRIAAHHAIQAMEEEATEIRGRRELTNVFDIALPTQQGRGAQGAVFGEMIGGVDPGPQTLIEVIEGERLLPIQIGQELFPESCARGEPAVGAG